MSKVLINKENYNYGIKKLAFPAIHLVNYHEDENERIHKAFGGAGWSAAPTTVDIVPGTKELRIVLNGTRHHYDFSIPITFDKERYKRIYESLKKSGIGLYAHEHNETIKPDACKLSDIDFESWDKEKLVDFIRSGRVFIEDKNKYFDSKIFDLKYMNYPALYNPYDGKQYLAEAYLIGGLLPLFCEDEAEYDYRKLILINKEIINLTLNRAKYTHLYKIRCDCFYLTKELTVRTLAIFGCEVK